MPTHFDHLTIVVRDVDRAKAFFAILGFKEPEFRIKEV
jgi:catechol 2,3-dioxygenase-like lactoylglutathione lyase family enzyme